MEKLKNHIKEQFESNSGKNIFSGNSKTKFQFINGTDKILEHLNQLSDSDKTYLISIIVDTSIKEFCKLNQYYSFDLKAKNELCDIYSNLFGKLTNNNIDLQDISQKHYKHLQSWLLKTNPFAGKIYQGKNDMIKPVPCSEYSARKQIELLNIDLDNIKEPVLDIGCGESKNLIVFLKASGLKVFGIDRLTNNSQDSLQIDWLEFDYGINKWGTIISNLGFSNHFKHHHLRVDGSYINYAQKYVSILNSLKPGGRFYYAPDLPFIEKYLDEKNYRVDKIKIAKDLYGSIIEKRSDFQNTKTKK